MNFTSTTANRMFVLPEVFAEYHRLREATDGRGVRRAVRPSSRDTDRCGVCHTRTRSEIAKWKHVRLEHGDNRRLMCSRCDRRFSNGQAALLHERVHHAWSAGHRDGHAYTCELCARYFPGRRSLAAHVAHAHPAALPALCGVCAVYAGDVPSLLAHVHAKHGSAGRPERLHCDLCRKRCRGQPELRSHRRVHGVRDVVHREHVLHQISDVVLR